MLIGRLLLVRRPLKVAPPTRFMGQVAPAQRTVRLPPTRPSGHRSKTCENDNFAILGPSTFHNTNAPSLADSRCLCREQCAAYRCAAVPAVAKHDRPAPVLWNNCGSLFHTSSAAPGDHLNRSGILAFTALSFCQVAILAHFSRRRPCLAPGPALSRHCAPAGGSADHDGAVGGFPAHV